MIETVVKKKVLAAVPSLLTIGANAAVVYTQPTNRAAMTSLVSIVGTNHAVTISPIDGSDFFCLLKS